MCGISAIVGPSSDGTVTGLDRMGTPLPTGARRSGYRIPSGLRAGTHAAQHHRSRMRRAADADATGRYRITFNGEIYNYAELRDELLIQGAPFRTHSDTEVVLAAYAHWCVRRSRSFGGCRVRDLGYDRAGAVCSADLFG